MNALAVSSGAPVTRYSMCVNQIYDRDTDISHLHYGEAIQHELEAYLDMPDCSNVQNYRACLSDQDARSVTREDPL